jgi:YVTN family beta-propeller protein
VVSTVLVGSRPREAAFAPDGGRLYVTAEIGGVVNVVDVMTNQMIGAVKIDRPDPKPKGIVAHPRGRWVYVANGGSNDVAVIDAESRQVTAYVPVGRRPWGIAITLDGGKLYVANGASDSVSVIDTVTLKVIATVPVGSRPWGLAVSR